MPVSARQFFKCQYCRCKTYRTHPTHLFCSVKCSALARPNGEGHPGWKGGIKINPKGYILQRVPGIRYQYQHRLIMEKYLGRSLLTSEHVHHLNGIKSDNRIENLALLTHGEHSSLTGRERMRGKWSRAGHTECLGCHSTARKHNGRGYCTMCYQKQQPH